MIIVYLMGGLGNQMFCRAFGLALEKKWDDVTYTTRSLNCGPFAHLTNFSLGSFVGGGFDTLRIMDDVPPAHQVFKIQETSMRYNPAMLEPRTSFTPHLTHPYIEMMGNWQSEKYFQGIAGEVRQKFQFTKTRQPTWRGRVYEEMLRVAPVSVAIHVRRGDYESYPETRKHHGLLSLAYYKNAMKYIEDKVGPVHYFVFSDDRQWCEANMPGMTIVTGTDKYDDLYLMSLCRHSITANSALSWWGAWLGDDKPGRVVVAPKRWLAAPNVDTSDVVPERWTKMEDL